MSRIPDSEIDRIKREVPIDLLARGLGMALKKQGADLVTLCWARDEKNPSMHLTPSKGLYHCFSCGAAGSVIDFVMQVDGVSFSEAAESLLSQLPGRDRGAETLAVVGIRMATWKGHAPAPSRSMVLPSAATSADAGPEKPAD